MAKPFTFSLETLIRVRARKRDLHQRLVAEAGRAVQELEEQIDRGEREIEARSIQLRNRRSSGRQDVEFIRADEWYLARLRGHLAETRVTLAGRKETLEAKRAVLAEAAKSLKAIEMLRERHRARHEELQRRVERAEEDEIAVTGYLRERQRAEAARTDQKATWR
jgi:flagellar export protein FliJ